MPHMRPDYRGARMNKLITHTAMTSVPFLDLTAEYAHIKEEITAPIGQVSRTCRWVLGPQVQEFEKAFADYIGTDHMVGVGNGLDALRLALLALNIGAGDEVVVPANTFIATALAVTAVGATLVLADCDERTYNLDPQQAEALITRRTRAVIPVHMMGLPANIEAFGRIAGRHSLHVLEDCAQAHGAIYGSKRCGSFGIMGCFSFYPSKNLGAYGDAGAIATSDPVLAERLRMLGNYGQRTKYEHVERGLNSRLDTLQAAILSVKLKQLDRWNAQRACIAEKYRCLLAGVGDLRFQAVDANSSHVYHLCVIETQYRDAVRNYLTRSGISTGLHYPVPIHLQGAYKGLGYGNGAFPRAERLATSTLSLPMYPHLLDAQIDCVCSAVKRAFEELSRLSGFDQK
jgi:dTDP-4-amino-4,6-dideoxygalactose transaminase